MYYVYVVRIDNEVVYVGKGSGDRSDHINSGTSSNYEANKSHFSGIVADVERITTGLTEPDAFELETHLIKEISPKWNGAFGTGRDYKTENSTSEYLGVSFIKNKPVNPYRAWYRTQTNKKHIGYFQSALEAANARDAYITEHNLPGTLNSAS